MVMSREREREKGQEGVAAAGVGGGWMKVKEFLSLLLTPGAPRCLP